MWFKSFLNRLSSLRAALCWVRHKFSSGIEHAWHSGAQCIQPFLRSLFSPLTLSRLSIFSNLCHGKESICHCDNKFSDGFQFSYFFPIIRSVLAVYSFIFSFKAVILLAERRPVTTLKFINIRWHIRCDNSICISSPNAYL